MTMNIITLILWVIIGTYNLTKEADVDKVDYFLCWLMLIIQLLK